MPGAQPPFRQTRTIRLLARRSICPRVIYSKRMKQHRMGKLTVQPNIRIAPRTPRIRIVRNERPAFKGRGIQKRQRFLSYLRSHPEELRPFDFRGRKTEKESALTHTDQRKSVSCESVTYQGQDFDGAPFSMQDSS